MEENVSSQLLRIKNYISHISKAAGDTSPAGNIVDIQKMESRNNYIEILTDYGNGVDSLREHITRSIETLSRVQAAELDKINNICKKIREPKQVVELVVDKPAPVEDNTTVWTEVVKRQKANTVEVPVKQSAVITTPTPAILSKIKVVGNYSLDAVKVPTWEALSKMRDGLLYYVESSDCFAIRICGLFLHGNIGVIYTNSKEPPGIKNCRFGNKCTKNPCYYYHNPYYTIMCKADSKCTKPLCKYVHTDPDDNTIVPKSKDKRNFIAGSWLYSPPVTITKTPLRSHRKFGSIENIETDISALTHEDGDQFLAQTMHDLLCSLLLRSYRNFGDPDPKDV
jgi:hypothetical protein